jgi:hypothetical protein
MDSDIIYVRCQWCPDNFPMHKQIYEDFEDSGRTFHCPNGHCLHITRTSITSRMRNAEFLSSRKQERINRLYKRIASIRGVQSRYKNRLLRGMCPYCAEMHADICKHIQEKHAPKK